MANLEAVKFVESYKLERFITDGLNSGKFGHGAVEILSEIYVLERSDVAPVVHARWYQKKITVPKARGHSYLVWSCSACHKHERKRSDYCPNCGAKMDGEMRNDGNL